MGKGWERRQFVQDGLFFWNTKWTDQVHGEQQKQKSVYIYEEQYYKQSVQ